MVFRTRKPVPIVKSQAQSKSHAVPDGSYLAADEQILLNRAVWGLAKEHPEFSASTTLWAWQKGALALTFASLVLGHVVWPIATLTIILAVLVFAFFCVVVLRSYALWHFLSRKLATRSSTFESRHSLVGSSPSESQPRQTSQSEECKTWPTYAVLVPLLKEAQVVPFLVRALDQIDYPKDRLEVSLIVENFDVATYEALRATNLPDHMRIVVVPDGEPRTKPRALNYALQTAKGEFVVVFDAEDVPDPDQLRRAVQILEAGGGHIGCVQACLNVYNPMTTWFTRHFTVEYTALFDAILPALQSLKFPIPLGGTSNHFPRRVLEEVGAWDPFNVTEDADLGFRLARNGLQIAILNSTTWEEAPQTFSVWLKQRTRWLKGWMQTFLVHLRQPLRLTRELGLRKTVGLHVLLGGLLLAAIVHPWFYILLAGEALGFGVVPSSSTTWGNGQLAGIMATWLFFFGLVNLFAGYIAAIAIGAAAVSRRGRRDLAISGLTMPIYWLLISLAAYRALFQLITAPHNWEKTEHGCTRPPGF